MAGKKFGVEQIIASPHAVENKFGKRRPVTNRDRVSLTRRAGAVPSKVKSTVKKIRPADKPAGRKKSPGWPLFQQQRPPATPRRNVAQPVTVANCLKRQPV